jgi:hypothetical protein
MTNPGKNVIPLQDELPSLIQSLRVPAGDDPRFGTRESIAANYEAFQAICHAAWKDIHTRSIDAIMTMEGILSPERRKVMPPAMEFYFQRCIQIWRRMNDALIWVLLGYQDHVIRTVCHRKERQLLASANPGPMRKLLENLNADSKSIAVWTDATTCVDVGDIFCRAPRGKPNGFLEVKEGSMNDKIFELLKAKGSPAEISVQIDAFVQENGPKALKQLERVIRQRTRYNEVLDIVQYEKGYDSRRDAEVIIEESKVTLESYDPELQAIIDEAVESPVLRSLDRCLWIYVDRDPNMPPTQKIEDFRIALQKAAPDALPWIQRNFQGKLPFEAIPLEGNLYSPEAVPLFLRPLRAETIRDVLLGNLMDSVYIFLDWRELSTMIQEQGAELAWSTFKEGRREQAKPYGQRKLTIGERVPRFQTKDGHFIEGFSKVYRIYFDGFTPSSIVAQYLELLQNPQHQRHDGAQPADDLESDSES